MTSALVVVDALNDFVSRRGKGWPMLRSVATEEGLVAHMQRAIAAARARDIPVLHAPHRAARDMGRYRHPTPNQELARLTRFFNGFGGRFHPDLMPRRGEVVVSAHDVSSAFGGTDLDLQLRSLDVDEIVVCGLLANTCIESTVRQGVDLGYRVTVLADAVAAWTRADHMAAVDGSLRQVAHTLMRTSEFTS
jgi:nicotinamidase-related amidase